MSLIAMSGGCLGGRASPGLAVLSESAADLVAQRHRLQAATTVLAA